MVVWLQMEKTSFCSTQWEESIYKVIVSCIYCFDFYNVSRGKTRMKMMVFYLVIVVEDIIFGTIYLIFSPTVDQFYFVTPVIISVTLFIGMSPFFHFISFSSKLFLSSVSFPSYCTFTYYGSVEFRPRNYCCGFTDWHIVTFSFFSFFRFSSSFTFSSLLFSPLIFFSLILLLPKLLL
jgi:hypothetical protein